MIGSFNDTPAHYLVLVQEKLQPDTEKPTLRKSSPYGKAHPDVALTEQANKSTAAMNRP